MAATDDRHLRHHWWERGNTKPHLSSREDAGASKLQKQPEIRAPLSDSINTVRNGSGVARRSPGKSAPKLIRATSKVLPWRNGGPRPFGALAVSYYTADPRSLGPNQGQSNRFL